MQPRSVAASAGGRRLSTPATSLLSELELALRVDDVAVQADDRLLEDAADRIPLRQRVERMPQKLDRHAEDPHEVSRRQAAHRLEDGQVLALGPGFGDAGDRRLGEAYRVGHAR